ncbi:MAG TPA: hypothetical protein VFF27_16010 [Bacteroidia bacterium]|jgi:hypothetical protein|nr:hypothetical protein [Bacteroidia bacterium]
MRDVFYTLLVIWVIWRIIDALSNSKQKSGKSKVGETTVSYTPPETTAKKKYPGDDEGEYVDYEEIK